MKCLDNFKDVKYNSDLFCKNCGMDVGLNPIKTKKDGEIKIYCCKDCSKLG